VQTLLLTLVCHCLSAADNVGDNVGDIAGMGADLFGSFAESTCAALVVAGVSELGANHNWPAMMFPLMVSATGIIVCMLTTLIATDLKPARHISEIEHTLKMQLIISTVLMTPVSCSVDCAGLTMRFCVGVRLGHGVGWLTDLYCLCWCQ
jgi:inorganic pyrophosphatase